MFYATAICSIACNVFHFVKLFNDDNVTSIWSHEQLHQNLQPGKYVACYCITVCSVWYIGAVVER